LVAILFGFQFSRFLHLTAPQEKNSLTKNEHEF